MHLNVMNKVCPECPWRKKNFNLRLQAGIESSDAPHQCHMDAREKGRGNVSKGMPTAYLCLGSIGEAKKFQIRIAKCI